MTDTDQKTFNERMKAFFAGIFDNQPAAKTTFSEAEVQTIATKAAADAVTAAVAPLEARLKAQETQFSEREKVLTTSEIATRAIAAINQVKAKGAWIPAFDKMGLPVLFEETAKITAPIEFGEGTSKQSKTPLVILTEFMEGLGKIVPNAAVYTGQSAAVTDTAVRGVNAGAFGVDGVELHKAALQFAEENKVTYVEAIAKVIEKNPDLAKLGGASAGKV